MRLLSTFLLLYGMVCAAFAQTQLSPAKTTGAIYSGKQTFLRARLTEPACVLTPDAIHSLFILLSSCKSAIQKNVVRDNCDDAIRFPGAQRSKFA